MPQVLTKMNISESQMNISVYLGSMNQNFSKGNLEDLIFNRREDKEEPVLRRRREIFPGRMNNRYKSSEVDRFWGRETSFGLKYIYHKGEGWKIRSRSRLNKSRVSPKRWHRILFLFVCFFVFNGRGIQWTLNTKGS